MYTNMPNVISADKMIKYKDLHKWMLLPMAFMQYGIFKDYWGDFTSNAWSVHIHYWTGTIWYLYLIIQPYYATHGKLERHRTNGIIGIFVAGGVCLTALSMMHRDILNAETSMKARDAFGPFEPWFFYGVAVVEIVMMTSFAYTIIQSIIYRKKIEDHAWWLISSVFIIMMPALGRGVQNLYVKMNFKDWPNVDIMIPIFFTEALIVGMLLAAAWKYDKLKHPATYVAIAVNALNLFIEPIGKMEIVQSFFEKFHKGLAL